jgi:hypothetical protein
VAFSEREVVRVVQLGRIGGRNTEGSVEPNWAVGREAIVDHCFEDGAIMVWLEEPLDGWQMWIFGEDALEATGKTATELPDERLMD